MAADEDSEELATPTQSFRAGEVTSVLPDDSREEDERAEKRKLRGLRARVKVARAVVATTPRLAEALASDWRKAARFYARFGVAQTTLRHGVPNVERRIRLVKRRADFRCAIAPTSCFRV
jgi:hypothetical protein